MFFFLHRKEVLGFQFLDTGPSYCTKKTLCVVNPKFMLHMLRALSFYLFIIITSRGRVPNANVLIMSALFCLLRRKDKISFFFRGLFSSDHSKGLPHHKGPIRLWCGGGPTWRWEFNCPPPPSQTPPPLLKVDPPGPLSQPFGAGRSTSASLIRGPAHAAKCW